MIPLEVIHKAIWMHFKMKPEDVFKDTRKRKYLRPRQIFHYLSRYYNKRKMSLEFIGMYSNNKFDHATVGWSVKCITEEMETYKHSKEEIESIKKLVLIINQDQGGDFYSEKYDLIQSLILSRSRKRINKILNNYLETA